MEKLSNKSKLIITIILRNIIYLCWYGYALIMMLFINTKITDTKLFMLFAFFLGIYLIREVSKHLYKLIAHKAYHEKKHEIELKYYKKLNEISMEKLDKIDKDYLSNKILEVSYNSTKIICDLGEYMLPAIIGLILMLFQVFSINFILGIIIIVLLLSVLFSRYRLVKNNDTQPVNNYNDLLKDFVKKIHSIRKLNIFDYTYKKLDKHDENDIIILKHNDEVSDIRFNNGIFIILTTILLATFFIIDNTTTKLGIMIFFSVIIIKLQNLLYQIAPTIINIKDNKKNTALLDSNFEEHERPEYEYNWKQVVIKDGIVKYGNGVNINIPSFELIKGDQVSILGKSGQGKSTVLNVLSGVLKLSDGKILFDDKEKNKIVDAYHMTRDTSIFKISLRENILLGEKVSDDVLLKMINEVGLTNWYNTLVYGLDTILDEKEVKMNNSQKQKINILRAMNTSKDIIFLDEPTSDLDVDNESKVAEMIKKYLKKKTIIIVTHKPLLTTICKKHFFIQDHTLLEKEPLL